MENSSANESSTNFIRKIIKQDLSDNKNEGKVVTRFPPEPNGFLHIGHAKSICLNFSMAKEFGGKCHLRFDDTNPDKEDQKYIDSIQADVKWLGFDWGENLFYASDYFEKLYQFAADLIKEGKAYVCELSSEQTREYRGTLTEPGKDSPYRNRSVDENLALFEDMKAGKIEEGKMVVRAKIDMASPNLNMRDPVIYRVKKSHHPRTGNDWCIYPMYDFTHCISDSLEMITHSLCTLEFEDHRPLYDWVLDNLSVPSHPQQIEFARLNLEYTVMSKRKLLELVETGLVNGWDDPRMPTVSGMRRRGFTSQGIRSFCERIGISKKDTVVELGILEEEIREDLNKVTKRVMAVLDPIEVEITNWDSEDQIVSAKSHPSDESYGMRSFPFGRHILIDREDFMEEPPKKYRRLAPGGEVRLRNAYVIQCNEVIKNNEGKVIALKCTYDPDTFGGKTPEGKKKVKGIIHWVHAKDHVSAEVRVYDRLFAVPNPQGDKTKDYKDFINPDSLVNIPKIAVEKSVAGALPGEKFQFERLGYFCLDEKDSTTEKLVFNRTITLKDTWANGQK